MCIILLVYKMFLKKIEQIKRRKLFFIRKKKTSNYFLNELFF